MTTRSDSGSNTETLETPGLTRRELLRTGALGGASAMWMAPVVTIHSMSRSVAEPTSGFSSPEVPDSSDEPEPKDTTAGTQPENTGGTTGPEDTTTATQPEDESLTQSPTTTAPDVDVLDTEVTGTAVPDAPSTDDVTVAGKVITPDVDQPTVAAPTANPAVIAQVELPKTGFDVDRAAVVGTALTGVGAALLAATREQPED